MDRGWYALVIAGLIPVLALGVHFATEGAQDGHQVLIPNVDPGASASYVLEGGLRSLEVPAFVSQGDPAIHELREVHIEVGQGKAPDRWGRLLQSQLLNVTSPNGTRVLTFATSQPGDGVYITPHRTPQGERESFDPQTEFLFTTSAGPLDAFLFDGAPLEPGTHALKDLVPWAERLEVGGELSLRHATAEIVPIREPQRGVTVQVQTPLDLDHPELQNLSDAVYTFEPGCPFPSRIEYQPGNPLAGLVAERTSCSEGQPGTIAEPPAAPRPTSYFVRAFPGNGAGLPLPYREALEAFLQIPRVQLFMSQNPSWILRCAHLVDGGGVFGASGYSWFFEIVDRDANESAWITRIDEPVLQGGWIEDPEPPTQLLGCDPREADAPLRGQPMEPLDVALDRAHSLLDLTSLREETSFDSLEMRSTEYTVHWSRCAVVLEDQGGGRCRDWLPVARLGVDGSISGLAVERSWLAEEIRHLG